MITLQRKKTFFTRKMMENNEATCNVYERWEFSVVITDPHLKKGTFTVSRSFKHVRLQHRNGPNMNLFLTIQNKYEHILKLTTVSTHPSPVICSCRLWEYDCVYMWGQPCVPTAPCTPRGLDNMAGLWLMATWRTQPWKGGRLACRPGTGIPSGGLRNGNQWSQTLYDL